MATHPVRKSSLAKKSSPVIQGKQTILVADSILRKIKRLFCKRQVYNRMVCCFPEPRHYMSLKDWIGFLSCRKQSIGDGYVSQIIGDFRELRSMLKQKTVQAVFSEVLSHK